MPEVLTVRVDERNILGLASINDIVSRLQSRLNALVSEASQTKVVLTNIPIYIVIWQEDRIISNDSIPTPQSMPILPFYAVVRCICQSRA